jgi:hypothetical protein
MKTERDYRLSNISFQNSLIVIQCLYRDRLEMHTCSYVGSLSIDLLCCVVKQVPSYKSKWPL